MLCVIEGDLVGVGVGVSVDVVVLRETNLMWCRVLCGVVRYWCMLCVVNVTLKSV